MRTALRDQPVEILFLQLRHAQFEVLLLLQPPPAKDPRCSGEPARIEIRLHECRTLSRFWVFHPIFWTGFGAAAANPVTASAGGCSCSSIRNACQRPTNRHEFALAKKNTATKQRKTESYGNFSTKEAELPESYTGLRVSPIEIYKKRQESIPA